MRFKSTLTPKRSRTLNLWSIFCMEKFNRSHCNTPLTFIMLFRSIFAPFLVELIKLLSVLPFDSKYAQNHGDYPGVRLVFCYIMVERLVLFSLNSPWQRFRTCVWLITPLYLYLSITGSLGSLIASLFQWGPICKDHAFCWMNSATEKLGEVPRKMCQFFPPTENTFGCSSAVGIDSIVLWCLGDRMIQLHQ